LKRDLAPFALKPPAEHQPLRRYGHAMAYPYGIVLLYGPVTECPYGTGLRGEELQHRLAGFAEAKLDGINQPLADLCRQCQPVHQNVDGRREIDLEQRLRG